MKLLKEQLLAFTTLLILGCNEGNSQKNISVKEDSPLMLAGRWVPSNPGTIDFEKLPRFSNSEHAIVHDVRAQDGRRVNQHNYMIYFGGHYWMMWSDGPGVARAKRGEHRNKVPGHDQAHQKVSYATSKDGLKWSEAKDITDAPVDEYGWIARGFWVREGQLLALVTRYKAPGYAGEGLALHAFSLNNNATGWKDKGVVAENAMNNFPPTLLPTGEWMMSRRDSLKNVYLMFGGDKAFNQWQSAPIVQYEGTDFKAEEPCSWLLPDKRILSLFRDNAKSGFLYRSYSSDNGRKWTKPVKTNFPDATSKFSDARLQDGRYVLVSNPNPKQRDPLTLAISNDGIVFHKMIYLVGGRHIDYPHVMEHDGYLFIAFASAKQTVEVIRIKVKDIDKISMPETVMATK